MCIYLIIQNTVFTLNIRTPQLFSILGVVGWCEGVMYLKSNDIGLQLGKACYPCSREG